MKNGKLWRIAVVLALLGASGAFGTALDDYVAKPDASYRYSVVKTIEGQGFKAYVLDMISQSWRSSKEVDRTEWQHWLTIIKPDKAEGQTALLYINGGSNDRAAPSGPDMMLGMMAIRSNSVVAELKMVPNQPLVFPDGGGPRYEDAIIAYTFDKYLRGGDANWPLLLPMVKSAVRAMDTVQEHLKGLETGAVEVEKFVVSGASKRGWTTWLTAAVDRRVVAICPAVIDVLNMGVQMKHHFAAYGFWAPAIRDYERMKVFDRLDTERGNALISLVDPYSYRQRYTMPKFLLNSTGDQFFLPDSAQFYFHDLPGEKYLRYFPNTGHGLDAGAYGAVLRFYRSILAGDRRPEFSWRVNKKGAIVVETVTEPKQVKLWQATNPQKRDFRIDASGVRWSAEPLQAGRKGRYVGRVAEPERGWRAYFVELVFAGGQAGDYRFTTEVHVLPERLPFADRK